MPKMKTRRGVAKRVKVTATGRLKRRRAFKSHILTKKRRNRKRKLRHPALVSRADEWRLKRLLPGA